MKKLLPLLFAFLLGGCASTSTDLVDKGIRTITKTRTIFGKVWWRTTVIEMVKSTYEEGVDKAQDLFFYLSLACFGLAIIMVAAAYVTKGYKKFGIGAGLCVLMGLVCVTFMCTIKVWMWFIIGGIILAIGVSIHHYKDRGWDLGKIKGQS